ncbi:hypothetical protein [Devosia sp. LC5]|uniref:hypothetical protein n=1 Tax=Devosia sp. LC5 TaxID=1502724 RepID=UPI000ACF53D5|nr:hypothetical protein [Devosia sp. LC5]
MGEDALAYLDLNLPEREVHTESQKKHSARTARYKQEKALQMAPDSAAVQQATSNAVFGVMSRQPHWADSLFRLSVKELIDAGYDEKESKAAFLRLFASVDERRITWQRRTRQRLAAKVIEQLRALKR